MNAPEVPMQQPEHSFRERAMHVLAGATLVAAGGLATLGFSRSGAEASPPAPSLEVGVPVTIESAHTMDSWIQPDCTLGKPWLLRFQGSFSPDAPANLKGSINGVDAASSSDKGGYFNVIGNDFDMKVPELVASATEDVVVEGDGYRFEVLLDLANNCEPYVPSTTTSTPEDTTTTSTSTPEDTTTTTLKSDIPTTTKKDVKLPTTITNTTPETEAPAIVDQQPQVANNGEQARPAVAINRKPAYTG